MVAIDGNKVYDGPWLDGQFHGEGVLTENDEEYHGNFFKGWRSGRGYLIYEDGDSYHGQWYLNQRHGKGEMRFANGDIE